MRLEAESGLILEYGRDRASYTDATNRELGTEGSLIHDPNVAHCSRSTRVSNHNSLLK